MERYFENVNIVAEDEKVQTATLYLKDTAMLWWRKWYTDLEKRLCKIETWAELKRELKKHFYPVNVEFQAYKKLRKLKHEGSLRDYVKEYSALLLSRHGEKRGIVWLPRWFVALDSKRVAESRSKRPCNSPSGGREVG